MKVLLIAVVLVIFIVILLSRKKHKSSRISSPSIHTSTDKNKETVLEQPKSQFNPIPLYEEEDKKSITYETLEDDTKTTSTNNNSYSLPPKKYYKSVYDYLLHDSRWLDCRNRILKRDGYRCKWCGEKYDLQIHHKYYHKLPNNHFVNPWEYDDDCFITLCKTCHDKFHENHNNKVYYRSYREHRSLLKRLKENERNKN